jgi:hypothetical protein
VGVQLGNGAYLLAVLWAAVNELDCAESSATKAWSRVCIGHSGPRKDFAS